MFAHRQASVVIAVVQRVDRLARVCWRARHDVFCSDKLEASQGLIPNSGELDKKKVRLICAASGQRCGCRLRVTLCTPTQRALASAILEDEMPTSTETVRRVHVRL